MVARREKLTRSREQHQVPYCSEFKDSSHRPEFRADEIPFLLRLRARRGVCLYLDLRFLEFDEKDPHSDTFAGMYQ